MNMTANSTPPSKAPKLKDLCDACINGASNAGGLIRSLAKAVDELPHGECRAHPAVLYTLGHLQFLCGQELGPSFAVCQAADVWLAMETSEPVPA